MLDSLLYSPCPVLNRNSISELSGAAIRNKAEARRSVLSAQAQAHSQRATRASRGPRKNKNKKRPSFLVDFQINFSGLAQVNTSASTRLCGVSTYIVRLNYRRPSSSIFLLCRAFSIESRSAFSCESKFRAFPPKARSTS